MEVDCPISSFSYLYNILATPFLDLSTSRQYLTAHDEVWEEEKIRLCSKSLTCPYLQVCLAHTILTWPMLAYWHGEFLVLWVTHFWTISSPCTRHCHVCLGWLAVFSQYDFHGCSILGTCMFEIIYCSTWLSINFLSHSLFPTNAEYIPLWSSGMWWGWEKSEGSLISFFVRNYNYYYFFLDV